MSENNNSIESEFILTEKDATFVLQNKISSFLAFQFGRASTTKNDETILIESGIDKKILVEIKIENLET